MAHKTLQSILVLAGGPGSEREVSLNSGRAILQALQDAGYRVQMADATPTNLTALNKVDYDLIFPIIHGTFGEDGQLQTILEQRKIPYVGSGPQASLLAMNKQATRQAIAKCDVPIAQGILILSGTQPAEIHKVIDNLIHHSGLPLVIKPNCEGSSVGVTIAADKTQACNAAIEVVSRFGDCLIEQFVTGRELTAGILVDTALPLVEIKAAQGFYDYEAKYLKNDTTYLVEPECPTEVAQAIQSSALKIFQAIGCRDLARIDFILRPDNTFIALEVNTLPGFTDHSLVPKAAAHLGWSMAQICDKIVQNAWNRSM